MYKFCIKIARRNVNTKSVRKPSVKICIYQYQVLQMHIHEMYLEDTKLNNPGKK